MTKRRTIEIIVETEELLVVKHSRTLSLKCSECGAIVEALELPDDAASSSDQASQICRSDGSLSHDRERTRVKENAQFGTIHRLRRLGGVIASFNPILRQKISRRKSRIDRAAHNSAIQKFTNSKKGRIQR